MVPSIFRIDHLNYFRRLLDSAPTAKIRHCAFPMIHTRCLPTILLTPIIDFNFSLDIFNPREIKKYLMRISLGRHFKEKIYDRKFMLLLLKEINQPMRTWAHPRSTPSPPPLSAHNANRHFMFV